MEPLTVESLARAIHESEYRATKELDLPAPLFECGANTGIWKECPDFDQLDSDARAMYVLAARFVIERLIR